MPSPIEEIKSRLSVADVVGSYLRLLKAGQNFKALCPFHREKTPSFYVSPAREIWHCFGCNAGGDIFRFVSEIEGVEFPEALEILAARAGVQLKKEDPRLASERRRLFSLLEEAAKFYEAELYKRQDVFAYLKDRGLTPESIKSFRLGYAPQSWDGVLNYLVSKSYRREEADRAGLLVLSSNPETKSRFYDRFRGRIMFPIADNAGRIVGFSGRIYEKDLPKGEEAAGGKYINTPQTVLFDKSRVLYLWDRAKNDIREKETAILVEGQMDALLSHQAGVRNVIATSGTALGKGHLNLIKRLASKIFFAFDADSAGELATKRGVDLALADGFEINIIEIPLGKDPAEAVRENPALWQEVARNAKPIIAFFLENLKKKFPEDLRALRLEANSLILPYVAVMENEIERAHWVQEISKALLLREEPIWEELRKRQLALRQKELASKLEEEFPKVRPKSRRDLLEERILGLLAWRRDEFFEKLEEKKQELFSVERQPLLECALSAKLPAGGGKLKENLEKLALEAELLYGEMPASPDASQGGERVHEEFHTLLAELEKENVKTRLEELSEEIRKFETGGNEPELKKRLEIFKELSQKLKP